MHIGGVSHARTCRNEASRTSTARTNLNSARVDLNSGSAFSQTYHDGSLYRNAEVGSFAIRQAFSI